MRPCLTDFSGETVTRIGGACLSAPRKQQGSVIAWSLARRKPIGDSTPVAAAQSVHVACRGADPSVSSVDWRLAAPGSSFPMSPMMKFIRCCKRCSSTRGWSVIAAGFQDLW